MNLRNRTFQNRALLARMIFLDLQAHPHVTVRNIQDQGANFFGDLDGTDSRNRTYIVV